MIVSLYSKDNTILKKNFLSVEIHHKRKIGVGDEESIFTVGNNNFNLF